jgi:nitrogen fixation protein FixH
MATDRNLWPLGIVLTLVLFFVGTIGLVVMACSQRADLVSPDYYERELKFQSRIDQVERTRHAAGQAVVAYDEGARCITVSLPAAQAGHDISGHIELYRPSAAGMDREVKFMPDAKGLQRLDAAGLVPGLWKVRVSWTFEQKDYFLDEKIIVGVKAS